MDTPILSPASTSVLPKEKSRSRWRRLIPTAADVFVLPYVLFLLAFGILPGVYALVLSFSSFANGTPQYFAAGLQNYVTAYTDFRFGTAFANVFQFLIISVPFGVIGVTAIALLIHARTGWFSHLMRTIYFLPGAVAGPTVVLLALFMCDPQVSPFRGLFARSICKQLWMSSSPAIYRCSSRCWASLSVRGDGSRFSMEGSRESLVSFWRRPSLMGPMAGRQPSGSS